MQSAAAERIATEIYDAIHDNVATKADLERGEAALRADLERSEAALRADLQRVEASLKADLARIEATSDARFGRLEHQITRMTNRLAGIVVVVATLFRLSICQIECRDLADHKGRATDPICAKSEAAAEAP